MSAKPITIPLTLAAIVVLGLAACGDGRDAAPATTTVAVPATTTTTTESAGDASTTTTTDPPPPGKPAGPAETATEDPRQNALERDAARAVGDYVDALDRRDGDAVCAAFVPGALAEVELPEPRPSCAASIEASIGYRDPRGLPVWEGARAATVRVAELDADGRSAKVIATVVTRFADRDEESIEDDVVYLTRAPGQWLVAKPSSTLYRAVGIADVPPSVLSPPN